jgi:hypothetical protein
MTVSTTACAQTTRIRIPDPWQMPHAKRMLVILTWDRLPLRRCAILNQEYRPLPIQNRKLSHAIFVASQATSRLIVLIKWPISKTLRPSFSRTRISWSCGKKPGMTTTSRYVQPEDDNLCPACHKPFTLDHRCDPEDKRISGKFDSVKAKLRQSPLLRMIQEAHEGSETQSSSTENATPFTMDDSFFLGEDEGQQDEEEYYPPESDDDEGTNSPHSDDGSDDDSQESGSDSYRSANSDVESYHSYSDAPFDNHRRKSATTQGEKKLKSTSATTSTCSTQA